MSWVFVAFATLLGGVLLWGFLAPRNQWRVLFSWTVSDPHAHEPGGVAYGWRRIFSAVGVLGLIAIFAASVADARAQEPLPGPLQTPVQQMWGSPGPRLVERVVAPVAAPPADLVPTPILGFQNFDEGLPSYVRLLPSFTLVGSSAIPGYIGSDAPVGVTAEGLSSLVVNVRGPLLCIPREAVVIETEEAVQIGIFYGLPDRDGAPPDHKAGCPSDASITNSVLVPIQLAAPIGERDIQDLTGTSLNAIDVVD